MTTTYPTHYSAAEFIAAFAFEVAHVGGAPAGEPIGQRESDADYATDYEAGIEEAKRDAARGVTVDAAPSDWTREFQRGYAQGAWEAERAAAQRWCSTLKVEHEAAYNRARRTLVAWNTREGR